MSSNSMKSINEEDLNSMDPPLEWTEPEPLLPPSSLPTPLKFEDLGRESKSVLSTTDTFDGFRFEIVKIIAEDQQKAFHASHSITMGSSTEPAAYFFGPRVAYKGTFIQAKWDTDLHVMGIWNQEVNDNLSFRFTGQSSADDQQSGFQAEVDVKRSNWYGTVNWSSVGTYALTFMQSITRRFSAGISFMHSSESAASLVAAGMRYESGNWLSSVQIFPGLLNVACVRKVTDKSSLATDITVSMSELGTFRSVSSVGFEHHLRMSHIKARVDTDWKVYCVLEEMLNQNSRIGLSGELDHKKKNYRFGISVSMNL